MFDGTRIPLAVPNLTGNEARYLEECVRSNFVSSVGPFVGRFEEAVARAAGSSDAAATSSGTTGLHVALTAARVGRDDLVIVPSLTFVASANAVAHCGAMPWLLDVSADGWTLDVELLEECLESETEARDGDLVHRETGRRVAAIMPVHALGTPADMDAIAALARRFRLPVVADAAAALGATCRGHPMGRCGADLTVFSFNGNKTVTAGGGGAVCGDDADLLETVRHLKSNARVGDDYDHDRVGFNYAMTNVEAAVGCAQLERLDGLVAAKRRISARYDAELDELPGVQAFPVPEWAESACWLSGFRLRGGRRGAAERVRDGLRARGIESRSFWKPLHLQAPYRDAPSTAQAVSEDVWPDVVLLPCSTGLTDGEQDRVITLVRDLLRP